MENVTIGDTYKICVVGHYTYGKIVERASEDDTFAWRSNHPQAYLKFWCYRGQLVERVADGTYLGNDGLPEVIS